MKRIKSADIFGIYVQLARRINHVSLVKGLQGKYFITIEGNSNNRFQYAQTVLASDSAIRHWYFSSYSAFSYHPDSGLRTFSGRLLGWEFSVNHKLEQQTVHSMGEWKYDEREVGRNGGEIQLVGYVLFVLLAIIFVIASLYKYI